MEAEKPLVSIIVITYNSSKYVLETLESAKDQTYQKIELIVSDDCSTDETVEICDKWIEKNKDRFVKTELITTEKNTGIPANCNRGIKLSQGQWIKIIAGDDVLQEHCIADNIECCRNNSSIEILFSNIQKFPFNKFFLQHEGIIPKERDFFELSASEQYKYLLTNSFIMAPAMFIKKCVFDVFGYFEEQYKLIEDLPFYLKLTKNGLRFYFMDKITVFYRISNDSQTRTGQIFYNLPFYKSKKAVYENMIYPNVSYRNIFFWNGQVMDNIKFFVLIKIFRNRKNSISTKIEKIFKYFYLSYIIGKIKYLILRILKLVGCISVVPDVVKGISKIKK